MADRLGDWIEAEPYSLAMSSGFFAFFAHTGMLDVVTRIAEPRLVSGSSAGALVAGAWATGASADQIREGFFSLRRDDFWDPSPGAGLLAGRKFDRLLRDMLPVHALEECVVPIAISVFDIRARKTTVMRTGDLPAAIRASCAVPALFHPVWIESRAYWDGGILDRPGIAGVPAADRLLFHHIDGKTPWGTRLSIPRRAGMVTLVIEGLPRSGPFRLPAGHRAFELAREATKRAIDAPIVDGIVRVSVTR